MPHRSDCHQRSSSPCVLAGQHAQARTHLRGRLPPATTASFRFRRHAPDDGAPCRRAGGQSGRRRRAAQPRRRPFHPPRSAPDRSGAAASRTIAPPCMQGSRLMTASRNCLYQPDAFSQQCISPSCHAFHSWGPAVSGMAVMMGGFCSTHDVSAPSSGSCATHTPRAYQRTQSTRRGVQTRAQWGIMDEGRTLLRR